MNYQQPFSQQMSNIEIPQSVSNTYNSIENTVKNTVAPFSSNDISTNTSFLTTNSIIAKISFIFLIFIGFIFLFRMGISLIIYFLSPTNNPYIIKGLIMGNVSVEIPQDVLLQNAIPLQRSQNKPSGMEFTWSVWLNITTPPTAGLYQHVFHKGDSNISTNPTTDYNNSPGLYLYRPSVTGSNTDTSVIEDNIHLIILMSSFDTSNKLYKIDIDNIPLKKWFHLAIRLENNLLDVYINGSIAQRTVFSNTVPRQNYGNIFVCQSVGTASSGFNGYLSDLRYFSYGLNVFSISAITANGPNLKPASINSSASSNTETSYLSSSWFSSKY